MTVERSRSVRAALIVVSASSRLVPARFRDAWRREWEAEVLGRWEEMEESGRATRGARVGLVLRSLGSAVDALMYRDGRGIMMEMLDDLVGAVRGLRRHPGFTAVVVLTVAGGVGASTAFFGVARDVLLRPFPYPEPDHVVAMRGYTLDGSGGWGNVTYPNLADVAAATTSFDGIGLARWWTPALEDDQGSVILRGATVTANLFSILGVEAGLGRFFTPDEQGEGRENLVVVSYSLWKERFGGDQSVIGRDLRLSGERYRVIGVTAADFEDPWLLGGPGEEPQIWRTVASPPSEWPRSGRSWKGIARLRSNVALAAAQAELDGAFARLVEEYPEENANHGMRITPLREVVSGPTRPVLLTLLGSVAVLVLIACANLANLMLGRALDREGELAVHRALGASGGRILRRSLFESTVLALAGGALGLVGAAWAGGIARGLGRLLPRPVTGHVDLTMIGFSLAVTAGCALLFGLVPAIRSMRSASLAEAGTRRRATTPGREGQRLRRTLVSGQLALTSMLLVGAVLLALSFHRLGRVELGLRVEGVSAAELHGAAWWDLSAEAAEAQWYDVLSAVRSAPGVETAGAIDYVPLGPSYSCDGIQRPDLPPPAPGEERCAEVRVVLPGALETLGVDLMEGRRFDRRDGVDAPPVTIVDESFAREVWPGEDPIGREIGVHTRTHRVVGVVRDMRHFGPGKVGAPMLYLPAPQEGWNGITRGLSLVIASDGPVDLSSIRSAVKRVNPAIAVGALQPLEGLLQENVAVPRFRTTLMVVFGVTALLLALLGVAGVMSYSVVRRTRELGVRLALGARPQEVRRLVLSEGAGLVLAGLGLGTVIALVAARALEPMLFEVSPHDPVAYLGTIVVLMGVSAAACYLPASRASRVDPIEALGSE